jgi:DNA-binding LacI/PurR family transcriptional regulator
MATSRLKDVAQQAGVSYKTVSRVVNGEPGVGEETRLRVQAAIDALGYQPNHSARSLRRGRTQTIRFILNLREMNLRQERFQDDVIAAVAEAGTANGYAILLELARGGMTPAELQRFGDKRADGTLLLAGLQAVHLAPILKASQTPTVIMANPLVDPSFGWVSVDFFGGAFDMVSKLLALGHRRIAHLADDQALFSSRQRLAGYRRALETAGVPYDDALVIVRDFSRGAGYASTAEFMALPESPTALFCVNDLTALGALEYLNERGISVPDQVSVTGFDDIPIARMSIPPLSTIHIPWYEAAHAATLGLIGAIEGNQIEPIHQELPVEIVLRGTTGPAPA